ncbi:MAG: hypothetical protein P4L33_04235 [Capsulimonadaceae bacterium]|nr:hypothetical protein [Capsulimonadaceae bacterium]
MLEKFENIKFQGKTLDVIEAAAVICKEYTDKEYDLSLRQLYYQFVARGLLPNSDANYKRLGDTIKNARLAGLIDWDIIKDRGRETLRNSHWRGPADIMRSAAHSFRMDTWRAQPNHVQVMVEKQALEGVLEPVCRELDIPFTANKGYSSVSALYETGKELRRAIECGKDVHVLYLGDHDPSGIDMTRDVQKRLSQFAGGCVHVIRVALNEDQIARYNPPPNPTKMKDTRAATYIRRFGELSWELDALAPDVLADLVRQNVLPYRDDDLHRQAIAEQDTHRARLAAIADDIERQEKQP